MKNSTNKILAIAVVLLLAANLVMVYMMVKRPTHRGTRREMRGGPNEIIKTLDLTNDQKKTYEQLKEEHFKSTKPLFDSIRSAKLAYFNLAKDSSVSDSMFMSYSETIREKQSQADRLVFEHFRKVRQIFTPAQQVKFDSLLKKSMMPRGGKSRQP